MPFFVLAMLLVTATVVPRVERAREASSPSGGAACRDQSGNPRWPVKTLTDAAVATIDYTPKPTTIHALVAVPRPPVGLDTPRMAGVERTVYRVRVALVKMTLEDDGDIHLIVADPRHTRATMIVELPDTRCPPTSASAKVVSMRNARAALTRACGRAVAAKRFLKGRATITGVGFFDPLPHRAPNGIELHPVLSFGSRECKVTRTAP
jgi:hypothetical protein